LSFINCARVPSLPDTGVSCDHPDNHLASGVLL